jgi:hypothetical protein
VVQTLAGVDQASLLSHRGAVDPDVVGLIAANPHFALIEAKSVHAALILDKQVSAFCFVLG